MSAYAALRDSLSNTYIENGDREDDDLIQYSQNSSDENESDGEEDLDYEFKNDSYTEVKADIESNKPQRISNVLFNDNDPIPIVVSKSNFFPSKYNFISNGTSVQIKLKDKEYIVIHGQCMLTILEGSVLINNHLWISDRSKKFRIIAPQSQALPMIASSPEVRRTSQLDQKKFPTCEDDFSAIISLESFSSGLETIGSYFSAFKDYLHSTPRDTNSSPPDKNQTKRTFEIVSKEIIGTPALCVDDSWSRGISRIITSLKSESTPQVFMVIGNKNTGKSTFAKSLLNSMILEVESPVAFLDLDPGQSEFSVPLSLSLTQVPHVNLGLNLPSSSQLDDSNNVMSHFFGFTSPIHQPEHYLDTVKRLFQSYQQSKQNGLHLIINTPGWIKGYGKEILISLTNQIKPDHLVLLSSSSEFDRGENTDILGGLNYDRLSILRSVNNESKFTAAQLREYNKLAYFHQKESLKFDFERHILHSSPFKVSYQTSTSLAGFRGISAISCLNYDFGYNFELEDMLLMIDSSVVGLYLVRHEHFDSLKIRLKKSPVPTLPFYINHADLREVLGSSEGQFVSLALIHSINQNDKYMNLYLPIANANKIKTMVEDGYSLLLIKGDGEMPSTELLNPSILKEHERQVRAFNQRKKMDNRLNIHVRKIPYVSFESKKKVGGVWRVRHNIMRRSHR